MKYKINYGNSVVVFPKKALEATTRAGVVELRVLLSVCAADGNFDLKKLSRQLGYGEDDVKEALSFWRGSGVFELYDGEASVKTNDSTESQKTSPSAEVERPTDSEKAKKESKKLRREAELPRYTSDELSDILEKRKDTATLINECQNIMGKVFNVREINVIIGLVDYLGLDFEYIMVLLTYCVSIDKKTLHYVEKTAFSLYDMGITDAEQLTLELRRRELAAANEGRIRSLFGIGERAFTTKEKKLISAWINDMNYPIEIIEKAYEVTADATGKASIPYANSVLERWNSESLRTLTDIEESYKKKEASASADGSFDTDSFFEAAVRRSLGGE